MEKLPIRIATLADHEAILGCIHAAFNKWVPIIGMKPLALEADYEILINRQVVYVMEDNDVMPGVIIMWPEGDALYVDTVAINPAYQKIGLGRQLMDFAEDQAVRSGMTRLTLVTNEKMITNQHFYLRLGFVETHREELTPGRRAVWMQKCLRAE